MKKYNLELRLTHLDSSNTLSIAEYSTSQNKAEQFIKFPASSLIESVRCRCVGVRRGYISAEETILKAEGIVESYLLDYTLFSYLSVLNGQYNYV